jgi:hypothetical protein
MRSTPTAETNSRSIIRTVACFALIVSSQPYEGQPKWRAAPVLPQLSAGGHLADFDLSAIGIERDPADFNDRGPDPPRLEPDPAESRYPE